jgi:hypothetical protein
MKEVPLRRIDADRPEYDVPADAALFETISQKVADSDDDSEHWIELPANLRKYYAKNPPSIAVSILWRERDRKGGKATVMATTSKTLEMGDKGWALKEPTR